MHVHVQKFTRTTCPRSSAGPSGSELSQAVAPPSDGMCTRVSGCLITIATTEQVEAGQRWRCGLHHHHHGYGKAIRTTTTIHATTIQSVDLDRGRWGRRRMDGELVRIPSSL